MIINHKWNFLDSDSKGKILPRKIRRTGDRLINFKNETIAKYLSYQQQIIFSKSRYYIHRYYAMWPHCSIPVLSTRKGELDGDSEIESVV